MKKIYFVFVLFLIACTSGEFLTIKEFKELYKTAEVEAVVVSGYINNHFNFEFYFDGEQHIIEGYKAGLKKGEKFLTLVDVYNPKKNYKILWHRPVIPDGSKCEIIKGNLTWMKKQDVDYVSIEYKYYISESGKRKRKRTEFVPNEYYEKLKEYYDSGKSISLKYCRYWYNDRMYSKVYVDRDSL